MPMKVPRTTLVTAAEEHYHHHQIKLKNLTQHNMLHYGGSPAQALLSRQLRSLPGSSWQTLVPEGDTVGMGEAYSTR